MPQFRYIHGFCVMRAQPFHIGHAKLIDAMLQNCAHVTIILGSIQEQGTKRNPFDYATRQKMLQNHYVNTSGFERMNIVGLEDIHNSEKWSAYVLDFLGKTFPNLPKPDVYYAGSDYDANWFKGAVAHIEIIDRNDLNFPYVSASMVRDMIAFGDSRWKNFVHPENQTLIETFLERQKSIF